MQMQFDDFACDDLIKLKPCPHRQMRPEVPYQRIDVMMPLDRAA